MLLEFKTKNYRSFRRESIFSMTAAPKQKGLDYSVYKSKINKKPSGLSARLLFMVRMPQVKLISLVQWMCFAL